MQEEESMCRKLIVNNLIKLGNRDICWEGLSLPKGEIWEMTAKQLINCIKQGKDEVYGLALDGEDNLVFDESFYTVNLMTKTHVNSFVPLKEQDCLVNCFYTVIGTHKEKNAVMYDVVSSKYERTSFDETMVKTLIQMGVINSGCTIQNDKIVVAPLEKSKPEKKEQAV